MVSQYNVEKFKEMKLDHHPVCYFESVKMGCVHCIHKERQISTFWTGYCLKSQFCIWQAKHHTLQLLQDEALNAYSFHFWKLRSPALSTPMFQGHHNFLPQRALVWTAVCSASSPAVARFEQGVRLEDPQKHPSASIILIPSNVF